MEGYIVIKKRTFFAAVAALAVAATAVLTWHFGIFGGIEKSMPQTAIRSYNTLSADGNNILYFTGISNDSTLTGITFDSKTIMFGSATAPYASELRAIIRHSKDSLENRIAFLEATMDEMGYYLKVHGVQDEGYDMVAGHYTATEKEIASLRQLADALESIGPKAKVKVDHTYIQKAQARPGKPKEVFVACNGGRWKNGIWLKVPNEGRGIGTDSAGRIISGVWKADTLTTGLRSDTSGIYRGLFSAGLDAHGHGTYTRHNGTYYEGHWKGDSRNGFGFSVDSERLRAGEWQADVYRGERLNYTSERIYGIDISRYQHGRGRRYYPIHWGKLRITDLGRISTKKISGTVDYPVSFIYIKSTEGTSIRNRYYRADYLQARKHGIHCGAYHFFSTRSTAQAQARHFIRNSCFRSGDLPPVLDVEPTERQIAAMGGIDKLFASVRTWMNIVRRHTGVRPILYVSQSFVNKHLNRAPDIKKNYNIWIARYGEYKPDIKLVYWQLCPDGRVDGIHGEVDINVFNGYHEQFDRFLKKELIK